MRKVLLCFAVLILLVMSVQMFEVEANPASALEPFVLTSSAFKDGGMMPYRYLYRGENKSPALKWDNVPAGTANFSITCIDYDPPANGYAHWQISNIPANYKGLPEGIPSVKKWNDGIVQKTAWIGPYPPNGVHSYHFVILAHDINGKTLAQAKLIGRSD